jgi:hypothetical protein
MAVFALQCAVWQTRSYGRISLALIPMATAEVYLDSIGSREGTAVDWRKLGVDVVVSAATVTVVFAALDTASDYLYLLTVAGALASLALILENGVTTPSAADMGSQPSSSAEPEPAGKQAPRSFDAPVVDAASA